MTRAGALESAYAEFGGWRRSVSLQAVEAVSQRLRDAVAARSPQSDARQSVTVGLIGRGIQASKSPFMHEREGARVGIAYRYILIDFDTFGLADDALGAVLDEAERIGFAGVNVTHPFKQSVIAHLGGQSPEAAAIGAVNTVVFDGRTRVGYNTDCWGFAESFREGLPGVGMGSVIQFGAGGAGAAVAHALLSMGVERLLICDTNIERAQLLAGRLQQRFAMPVAATANATPAIGDADGLVNATPVGMEKYPGIPFPREALHASHWVGEIVYFPPETELLRLARSLGCRTLSGTGMAVYQAVKAFELFTGVAPDRAAMIEHFRTAA